MTPPHVSILVAMAKNRVIGRNNALPWQLAPQFHGQRNVLRRGGHVDHTSANNYSPHAQAGRYP